jgi:hypothetical protein
MILQYTKFMRSSSGSLFVPDKLIQNEHFRTATIILFYTSAKIYLNKSCIFSANCCLNFKTPY